MGSFTSLFPFTGNDQLPGTQTGACWDGGLWIYPSLLLLGKGSGFVGLLTSVLLRMAWSLHPVRLEIHMERVGNSRKTSEIHMEYVGNSPTTSFIDNKNPPVVEFQSR